MHPKQNDILTFLIPLVLAGLLMLSLLAVLICSGCSNELNSSNSYKHESTLLQVNDIKLPTEELDDDLLYEKLDAYEKHFDADSYFVFIDTKYDVVGIYYGYKPLNHFRQKFPETKRLSITLEELPDYGIELDPAIQDYLNFFVEFPKTTPVIVCHVIL